jgi:hypothetical protein
MLLIMHHIALCTPYIALFNCDHLLHIQIDHVEPKTKDQAEQVLWVFSDPQASSCEDTNIAYDQGKTRYIKPPSLSFIYLLYLEYDS